MKTVIEWIMWALGVVFVAALIVFAAQNMDWNMERLGISFRGKFQQIYNVLLLWVPIIGYDIATEGDTIKALSIPETWQEKIACAMFWVGMAWATAVVIVWGN